ncbi:MAG: hypothetical protein E7463_11150 [Ruminococcaceae bacterium]|nr:hypothetical protein [Oscillospiraceae bacterium]
MFDQLTQTVRQAYEYVREKLYCPETHLIYDHHMNDWHDLPTPEEIAATLPNPCGYGTGMEDSMINGGSMIDAMIERAGETGDPEDIAFLHELVDGMLLTAEAGRDGYLPRSRTPWDGVSHYPDSSRDQYTLFLYAMHRFSASGMADERERMRIRRAVTAIAQRARRNVTTAHDWDLLREDGRHTLVTQMWGDTLGNHEVPRLPMLYLLAWQLSGEEEYLTLYRSLREEVYARLLPMTDYWHIYCVQQMQVSMQVMANLDPDEAWPERWRGVMREAGDWCVGRIGKVRETLGRKGDYRGSYPSFRELPAIPWTRPVDSELPASSPDRPGVDVYFDYWDAAHILFCAAIGGSERTDEAFSLAADIFSSIDYDRHVTGDPVQLMQAYYTWLKCSK